MAFPVAPFVPLINPQNVSQINQTFKPILFTYIWRIEYLHIDEYAIRIEYQLEPLLPSSRAKNSAEIISLWGSAVDNLGNEYESAGGAYGLSTDQQSIEGVLSFSPLPADEATTLTFFIEIVTGSKQPESIEFSAPLPPASSA